MGRTWHMLILLILPQVQSGQFFPVPWTHIELDLVQPESPGSNQSCALVTFEGFLKPSKGLHNYPQGLPWTSECLIRAKKYYFQFSLRKLKVVFFKPFCSLQKPVRQTCIACQKAFKRDQSTVPVISRGL